MRVIVDGAGRLASIAYTGMVPQPGERIIDVSPAEYDWLQSGRGHRLVNRDQLVVRTRQALAANAAYLAKQAPTQAEVVAQVRLLTREVDALVRLALWAAQPELLDDISDT